MKPLTHLSLFSGIGGLDLAAERAGFSTVGQCEFADFQYSVLMKHWPDVPKWRDIRNLTGSDFYERTGLRTVDIISGGFPCQPFSVAGKRRGKADDRYLWPEMLRVIKEIRPTWFIGENVAGIVSMAEPISEPKVESRTISRGPGEDNYCAVLSQRERMLLDGILSDVESAGYDVQPLIIPACAVEAPHRRERIFIVGRNTDHDESQTVGGFQVRQDSEPRGTCRNVADANSAGRQGRDISEKRGARAPCGESKSCSADVADSKSTGLQNSNGRGAARQPGFKYSGENVSDADDRRGALRRNRELPTTSKITGWGGGNNRGRAPRHAAGEWWSTEPDVGRVAYGVPSRVDRLKCLGNAVVPYQVYPIFQAIAEIERQALR